ncbi:hypothetical protein AB0J77_03220 [Micromonospora tulbaghiae]|uniref:hypothetical protein n=1 Tax=Micromonospora tulbaghiae TaxID=479978 RepID=UPI00343FFE39
MPQVYGDEPKPWLLAYGFAEGDELSVALRRHATKITFLKDTQSIDSQVRQSDYDALVVVGDVPAAARHLHVLQFGVPRVEKVSIGMASTGTDRAFRRVWPRSCRDQTKPCRQRLQSSLGDHWLPSSRTGAPVTFCGG